MGATQLGSSRVTNKARWSNPERVTGRRETKAGGRYLGLRGSRSNAATWHPYPGPLGPRRLDTALPLSQVSLPSPPPQNPRLCAALLPGSSLAAVLGPKWPQSSQMLPCPPAFWAWLQGDPHPPASSSHLSGFITILHSRCLLIMTVYIEGEKNEAFVIYLNCHPWVHWQNSSVVNTE